MTNANQLQPALQPNKMRHRHLVSVSLVGNDEDDNSNPPTNNSTNVNHDHHQQQQQENSLISNTHNIELTRTCGYGGLPQQHSQHQLEQHQKNPQHQNRRNNQRNNNNQQRFDSSNNNTNKKNRSSTLLIQKIPPHQNRIDLLNDHFQKFGSIVNIKVGCAGITDSVDGEKLDPESALIQYSSPFEANRAYRSTEPVLNNRFIKVFWARDREQSEGSNNNNHNNVSNKRKFPSNDMTSGNNNQQQQASQQDLRAEITKIQMKKFKQGPQHQQQEPIPPAKKVVFNAAAVAAARKRRTILMQRYRQQSDELNRKLRELLLNQRHLMTKLEELKQNSTDTSKQQQGLKKLIETNMERITEMQQKQLQLQQMIKTTSSDNLLTNSATNRVYNNKKKRTSTLTTNDTVVVDSTDIENVEKIESNPNVLPSHINDKPEDDEENIIDEEDMIDDEDEEEEEETDDDDDDDDDDPDEEV